jgi:hypothetical protein
MLLNINIPIAYFLSSLYNLSSNGLAVSDCDEESDGVGKTDFGV